MKTDDARRSRIEELRQQIREATGEEPVFGAANGCPPELEEAFLEHVLRFETAPERSLFAALEETGVALPNPDDLDDTQVTQKLWEVAHALANLGVFVANTDHLSDRALYEFLWCDALVERVKLMPDNPTYAYHIDATENGDDDNGILLYLKYYATDQERAAYAAHFPAVQIPEHCDPPYDRDRLMPDG